MRREVRKSVLAAIALSGAALLGGCGSSDDDVPPSEAAPQTPTTPTTTAPAPAPAPATPSTSCIPISTSQIGFSFTDLYFDWANVIVGEVPGMTPQGLLTLGGTATGGPYQRVGSDGAISMAITSTNNVASAPYQGYTGYPTAYPYSQSSYQVPTGGLQGVKATGTGTLSINPLVQQDILQKIQMGYIPGVSATSIDQICVWKMAINLGHYYYYLYGGIVYLYLNNTAHGYKLYF